VERRTLDGELRALVAPGLERRGYLAAFPERTGGGSDDPYRSLNLGFRTGDDLGRVRGNRQRLVAALDVPPFAVARQVHGRALVRVGAGRAGRGFTDPADVLPPADVLATSERAVPLGILAADCLSIALASPEEGVVVAVHAGWRGLARGILRGAVDLFGEPSGVAAAIGPAIGPCHYEVGPEVVEAVSAATPGGAVWARRGGRRFLDLAGTTARSLAAWGITEVEDAAACTACHPARFYSHRRDGVTGRQGMVVMRL
jgi:purine-nucleoside/S-methyl-5'-thioadenosine phosphorylase / adenosine deaminase